MSAVRLGVFVTPVAEGRDDVLAQVELAEREGLDLVGIQDHPYQRRFMETWSLLAFLAARTERVTLFPDVANLPLRNPAVMAKAAATIDLLSGGGGGGGGGAGGGASSSGSARARSGRGSTRWAGRCAMGPSRSRRSRRRSASSAACGATSE